MTFLMNAWYAAALSGELRTAPVSRRILGELVGLFRSSDGTPFALLDRCPHRFVPLTEGRVEGTRVRCGYHGLEFGTDGRCAHNPHGAGRILDSMSVRSFPLVERFGVVWIWMGDPERAQAAPLPDLAPLEDEATYTVISGYLHVEANYQLIADNLLDLSHVQYLHPDLTKPEGLDSFRTEVVQRDASVTAYLWKDNTTPHKFQRMFWNSASETGDSRAHMRWSAPSNLFLDTGITEVGAAVEDGVCIPQAHLVTPETELTSHYFWAMGRNVRRDDPDFQAMLVNAGNRIFTTEDKPMIELQQRAMGASADLMRQHPILLESDNAAMRARRVLQKLIDEEAATGRA